MTITDILIKYFTSRFSLNQNEVKFLINEWNASFTCHHKKKKKKHLVKDKLCFLNELTFLQRNNRFVAVARMIIESRWTNPRAAGRVIAVTPRQWSRTTERHGKSVPWTQRAMRADCAAYGRN